MIGKTQVEFLVEIGAAQSIIPEIFRVRFGKVLGTLSELFALTRLVELLVAANH